MAKVLQRRSTAGGTSTRTGNIMSPRIWKQRSNSTVGMSKDIMASFKAEKAREKVKEKAAARYLRIRALLDQADKLIAEAQLPKQMKNRFAAKILRARRELDLGDCPSKISENFHDIVIILKKDVKCASKLLKRTLQSLKKDLETIEDRRDGELLPRFSRALAVTQRQIRLPKTKGEPKSQYYTTPPRSRSYVYEVSRKAADAGDSPTPKTHMITGRPEKLVKEYPKEDPKEYPKENFPNTWYEYESEEDRKRMEMELSEECGTLDTSSEDTFITVSSEYDLAKKKSGIYSQARLHFALRILNEMGRPDLEPEEVRDLEMTMKRTKKMLLNRRECQKLRGPLETLQYAMELEKEDRGPAFVNALESVHKAVNAFEILDNLNSK